MEIDRAGFADFLRGRRRALQPEDVGLARGPRRRAEGLRREEVALLAGMSPDYYGRLEQQRGPQPSDQMLTAIARALHLTLDERDHLFLLAGHRAPPRTQRTRHVDAGIMRILDRLPDTPAQVMTELGETLLQTRPAVALLGEQTQYAGFARSAIHRWFTDPESRSRYLRDDHEHHGRIYTSQLRRIVTRDGPRSPAAGIAEALLGRSAEFERYWAEHEVGLRYSGPKRMIVPEVGRLDLYCQMLHDVDQAQALLIFTASAGTESYDKLSLLTVVAGERIGTNGRSPGEPPVVTRVDGQ